MDSSVVFICLFIVISYTFLKFLNLAFNHSVSPAIVGFPLPSMFYKEETLFKVVTAIR